MKRSIIVEGSKAVAEGVAGDSQGTAVLLEGLLGILPVLEAPGTACRACCTGHKHRGCSP